MSRKDFNADSFRLFNDQWALVTAGSSGDFNTMTISWGGLGTLWGRDVATVYIRPDRYTYRYMNENDRFTISFFPEEYRTDLEILGTLSGRDGDKVARTKLAPKVIDDGVVGFQEASATFICRKIYWQDLDKANLSPEIAKQIYGSVPVHRMFIGEVEYTI